MNTSPKRRLKTALALLIVALVALPFAVSGEEKAATSVLAPEAGQPETTGLIVGLLGKTHYRRMPVDDALSGRLLDRYLSYLDPSRVHLLESDIAEFEGLRTRLDDELRGKDVAGAYFIFNRFQRRRLERLDYLTPMVKDGLDKLDFETDEWVETDREDAAWPADIDAAKDLWRRMLKAEVIGLKLADRPMDEIRKTLARRYEDQSLRARQTKSRDVFRIYMNTFANLHDPHTTYLPPRDAENFKIDMKLSLTGIGALLRADGEYTKIEKLIAGGPAEKSGKLFPGDRITGVAQGDDGEMRNVIGWRLDEVVELIRGPKGTVVRMDILGVNQPDGGTTHVIRLVRDKVKLEDQAAKSEVVTVERGERKIPIGVIRLPSFYHDIEAEKRGDPDFRSSSRDVAKAIAGFGEKGVKAVILDLRDNGGGALQEAINLTGLFVGRRPVVGIRDMLGRKTVYRSDKDAIYGGPLLVLTNRVSASASEILAGAIQDYGRGIVAGGTTFGKGTVQHLMRLDRGQLKLTVAKFYRVSGGSTQGRGIVPDVAFPPQFDNELIGESALPDSLPWDSIDRIEPDEAGALRRSLPALVKSHDARIAADPEFIYFSERQAILMEARNATKLSLDLGQREESREKLTARLLEVQNKLRVAQGKKPLKSADEANDEPATPDGPDAWTREAAEILADLMALK